MSDYFDAMRALNARPHRLISDPQHPRRPWMLTASELAAVKRVLAACSASPASLLSLASSDADAVVMCLHSGMLVVDERTGLCGNRCRLTDRGRAYLEQVTCVTPGNCS